MDEVLRDALDVTRGDADAIDNLVQHTVLLAVEVDLEEP